MFLLLFVVVMSVSVLQWYVVLERYFFVKRAIRYEKLTGISFIPVCNPEYRKFSPKKDKPLSILIDWVALRKI